MTTNLNNVKSDFWLMEIQSTELVKVVFDDPVTEQEAQAHVMNETFQDIIDSETLSIDSFGSSEPLNVEDD